MLHAAALSLVVAIAACAPDTTVKPAQSTAIEPTKIVVGTIDGKSIYKQKVDGHDCYLIGSLTYIGYTVWSISCLP